MANFKGTTGDDILVGTAGNDNFNVTQGGNDTVSGDDGNDTINFGASLTAADTIDGGAGSGRVILSGDYSAGVTFADSTMTNVEELILRAGSTYRITLANGNVAAGGALTINGVALAAADALQFDGGAETNGRLHVIGGAGNDRLIGGTHSDVFDISHGGEDSIQGYLGNDVIRAGNALDAGDTIRGGDGNDTLELKSVNAVLGATTLLSVETIDIATGGSLTLNAATIAPGTTLTIAAEAATSSVFFDVSAKQAGAMLHVTAGAGNSTIDFGGALSAGDNAFNFDTINLNGDYSAPTPTIPDYALSGTTLNLQGDHLYDLNLQGSNIVTIKGAAASQLDIVLPTDHIAVSGSASDDIFAASTFSGSLSGGGGDDRLIVAQFGVNQSDGTQFNGGDGFDVIELNGSASFFDFASTNLKNVEEIVCDPGHSYTIHFNLKTSVSNPNLVLDGSALGPSDTLTADGGDGESIHHIIGGAGNDFLEILGGTIQGGGGADELLGGNRPDEFDDEVAVDQDQFIYTAVSDSTSTAYDRVVYFQPSQDTFKLWFQVTGVDATVASGALSTASFDTDLAAAVGSGQLAANHAVLFTPTAGTLSGDVFLIVDANGTPGYQAGADLVIQMEATDTGSLTTANFTT